LYWKQDTYSAYYAGNVAKGAVFLQLCGWMGTWELWAGAISDTEYQTRSGDFEYMQWFVDHFDKGIPFTNIVDKGYRCIMAAWPAGKQLFLQPAFARSDRKFNTREVNRSSTVASIDLATKELPTWPIVRAFSTEAHGRMRVPMPLQTFGLLGDFRLISYTSQYFSSGAL
jgi:hypothetical protein